jgi:hypothetical protein
MYCIYLLRDYYCLKGILDNWLVILGYKNSEYMMAMAVSVDKLYKLRFAPEVS